MSSTPVRRTGTGVRPRPRPLHRTSGRGAAQGASEEAPSAARADSLARAFPIPRLAVTSDALVLGGFLIVSLILRLWMLGDKPLHHDESLHATYAWYLMGRANPEYHYDPMMHGPLQFHMIAFFYSMFGSSPFTARLWSVTAGTALVLCPWLLRRQLGRPTTYVLMAILSLSPICLYVSRFAREDMQYGLFTFLMLVTLVRYVADRRDEISGHYRWLYLLAAAFVLDYAAKETIYLTAATILAFLGAQLAWEVVRGTNWWGLVGASVVIGLGGLLFHALAITALGALVVGAVLLVQLYGNGSNGPLSDAMASTPARAWGIAAAIIVLLFALLYWPIGDPASWAFIPGAHMVPTSLDVLGGQKNYSYSTDGLLGGLQYWQAQIPVARGGQPWYYYFLVLGLYEWLVVLFAVVGAIYILRRQRTFLALLFLWYVAATTAIFAWSSEKMPWNTVHLVIPMAVLAAIGVTVSVRAAAPWRRYLALAALAVTGLVALHNSATLSYVNAASPNELMVYVQTTPDVPRVVDEMRRIQPHVATASDAHLHVIVDSDDEWPFVYYLHDPNLFATDAYPSSASGYANTNDPVLVVGTSNGDYDAVKNQLASRYVAIKQVLRAWNPEEYKVYAEPTTYDAQGRPHNASRLERLGKVLHDVASPEAWGKILGWEIARRPFDPHAWDNDNNQLIFYFMVRKDLVQYLSPAMQAEANAQLLAQEKADPFYSTTKPQPATGSFGGGAGKVSFSAAGPIAVGADGTSYVIDPNAERVVVVDRTGKLVRTFGAAGSGPGQFHFPYGTNQNVQTGGIAVAPDGHVYVADTWNHRVQEFTSAGAFVRSFGGPVPARDQNKPGPGEFYGPRGLAVASDGDVYIADTGNTRIQVFSAGGIYRFSIGSNGNAPSQFREPSGVAIAGDRLYVADYWNQRIQIFDLKGHFVSQLPVNYWQSGYYDEPQIAADTSGHLYVPDVANARILVYTTNGQPDGAISGSTNGSLFSKPYNVALGPQGQLLVSDMGLDRVVRMTAPGR